MIQGIVVHGKGLGRTLGYPTANLDTPLQSVHLGTGVYAAYTEVNRKKYRAALIIRREMKIVEVHIIGYEGPDFYGSVLVVDPVQKVSEIEKLSLEELPKKIESDVQLVNRLLKQI